MPKKIKRTENEQKRVFIKCIEGGNSIALSCRASGLSRSFIYAERKKDTDFGKQVELAVESRIIVVEDALLKSAKNGNTIAQIFWLKNRGKGKWREKQEVEVTMPKVVNKKVFIQAGEEPVIKEEEPEKKEEIQGETRNGIETIL